MSTMVQADDTEPRSPQSVRLGLLLFELGNRTFAHFGHSAASLGLTTSVAIALHRIEPGRPGPMNELAGAMGCDPSYVTWLADQLEAQGWAERRPAPDDRRVKVLALTPAGVAMRERLLEQLAQLPFASDALSDEEIADLIRLLTELVGDALAAVCEHVPASEGDSEAKRQWSNRLRAADREK